MKRNLEIARAALCALSFVDSHTAQAVHVNRLLGFFKRYKQPGSALHAALEILKVIREAAELPGGYWFPAPLRRISIDGGALVLGPHPTEELQRTIHPKITLAGFARVYLDYPSLNLAEERLEDWMDRPVDLAEWTKHIFLKAESEMSPTIQGSRSIEIYLSAHNTFRSKRNFSLRRWTRLDDSLRNLSGVYLCRELAQFGQRNFFFAEIQSGKIVQETEVNCDVTRLTYGIDKNNGRCNTYQWSSISEMVEIELNRRLPDAERRLLTAFAIAQESESPWPLKYILPMRHFEQVKETFNAIGLIGECKIK